MSYKCPKCGKQISVTLQRKKWYHANTSHDLEHDTDTRTIDAVLMFIMNSGYKHNIWLCKECFAEWEKICKWSKGTWKNDWINWFYARAREVVAFT